MQSKEAALITRAKHKNTGPSSLVLPVAFPHLEIKAELLGLPKLTTGKGSDPVDLCGIRSVQLADFPKCTGNARGGNRLG